MTRESQVYYDKLEAWAFAIVAHTEDGDAQAETQAICGLWKLLDNKPIELGGSRRP